MSKTSYADVHLEVDPGTPQTERDLGPPRVDRDTPFRILVLGDFTGRASRGIVTKGTRKPIAVDRDNFEDLLESLQVQLEIPIADGEPLTLRFHELDDFHPDRLYQRVPVFHKLRDLRERLEDPKTFADAAQQLGISVGGAKAASAAAPPPPPPTPAPRPAGGGGFSFLDAALEETEARTEAPSGSSSFSSPRDPLARYISAMVGPHLVPKADPKQKEVLQMADAGISGAMRDLLHHPRFQALEAAWRGLYFLIKELETGPLLKVYILDISRDEVEADLGDADDLRTTALYKTLVEQTVRTPGAHPWAVVVGNYTFTPDMSDLNVLGRMGMLCRQAGAPLLSGASPLLLGCQSLVATPYAEDWKPGAEREGWDLIRSLPESKYIGLVLPRFLLRMPYGKSGEQTDTFAFEEMPPVPVHEWYLWGNPGFACAYLLGQCYAESGWSMQTDEFLSLQRLPSHVYRKDGEALLTPPAETFLTESAMEKIHQQGLMVLLSFANSDQMRLAGWRSIAQGNTALSCRWA
jgi:type VI secretion system protein ImpC